MMGDSKISTSSPVRFLTRFNVSFFKYCSPVWIMRSSPKEFFFLILQLLVLSLIVLFFIFLKILNVENFILLILTTESFVLFIPHRLYSGILHFSCAHANKHLARLL